jgi:emfourin
MRLRLDVSGGFAPQLTGRSLNLDVASLPKETQSRVEALVAAIRKAGSPEANPKLRDAMFYDLAISDDDGEEVISAADGSLTPDLGELVSLMKKLGKR